MTDERELLPCPFCGSTDIETRETEAHLWRVICGDCAGAMLASATEVGAIADWNTRITQSDEAREQALEEAAKAMDAKAAAIKRLYDAEPPGVVAASYSASWHAFKEAAAIIRALKRGAPRKRPAYEQGCDKEG